MTSSSYAVAIIVETPDGIPLVSDPQKPEPRFWKFPGGRNEPGETPIKTAMRELREETGISASLSEMKLIHEETRGAGAELHGFFVFYAKLSQKPTLLKHGAGGEEIRFFTSEEIKTMPNFFPNHRTLFSRFVLKAGT